MMYELEKASVGHSDAGKGGIHCGKGAFRCREGGHSLWKGGSHGLSNAFMMTVTDLMMVKVTIYHTAICTCLHSFYRTYSTSVSTNEISINQK